MEDHEEYKFASCKPSIIIHWNNGFQRITFLLSIACFVIITSLITYDVIVCPASYTKQIIIASKITHTEKNLKPWEKYQPVKDDIPTWENTVPCETKTVLTDKAIEASVILLFFTLLPWLIFWIIKYSFIYIKNGFINPTKEQS